TSPRICRMLRTFAILMFLPAIVYEGELKHAAAVVIIAGLVDTIFGPRLENIQLKQEKSPNPEKLYWPIRFVVFMFGLIMGTWLAAVSGEPYVLLAVMSVTTVMTSVLYFSACDSLPPMKRREYEAREAE
ncbi:hypothetical protein, partial [Staphylococcus aureus]|uniref:hypothetical protein n=1 Tax=Staphylococcus aureus TaxID=1280 RepID=UPI0039BE8577